MKVGKNKAFIWTLHSGEDDKFRMFFFNGREKRCSREISQVRSFDYNMLRR